jgi:choline-sulfatase
LHFAASDAQAVAPQRPNVLLITTDQQSVDAMSAAGNRWCRTPNMDSIAAGGVYFRNSYCSYPLCSPSRASLHTSRMPHEIGLNGNSLPIAAGTTVSGELFRAAGYDTGYAGKWHLPDSYPQDGITGFEVLNKARPGGLTREADTAAMNAAVEFLNRRRDKPFFLVVSFINPHDICHLAHDNKRISKLVHEKYWPGPEAELPPLPANLADTVDRVSAVPQGGRQPNWNELQWRRYRYAYYRLLEEVDQQVGGVLAALRKTGQEDHTLVVFTSDHGEGLGGHRWTGKMMFYEEEAAVPLIVRWPGLPARIDREHLVSTLDVLPTLCDYAGIQAPRDARGQSLRPVIENPKLPGHEFVVSERVLPRDPRSFMVRTAQYKYVVFPAADGQRPEMLFDLKADPGEQRNLAAQPNLAAELARHRRLLEQWNQTTAESKSPPPPRSKPQRRKGTPREAKK